MNDRTLTEALAALGLRWRFSSTTGTYEITDSGGSVVAEIHASEAWAFVADETQRRANGGDHDAR